MSTSDSDPKKGGTSKRRGRNPRPTRESEPKLRTGASRTPLVKDSKQVVVAGRKGRIVAFDETIMRNMGEGLYTVDRKGLVTSMNPTAERLFGWNLDELRGRKMH